MVTTDAVKRALAALATRTDTATRPYVAVLREADAARDDLRRAAGFLDAVGTDRLREAIAAAERDGRTDLARRGQAALDDYRDLQAAARGKFPSDQPVPGTTKSTSGQGSTQ